jgi:AhpD family alkylhydroperoxidase
MKARIERSQIDARALQPLLEMEAFLASKLESRLLHLIKMRASQINGCAYCIDMHSKDARAAGETEQRLYGLDAWRETPYYSDSERAALAYLEAVTRITEGHVPDSVFEALKPHFTQDQIVTLTLAASMINLWNRFTISLRTVPGNYRPGMHRAAAAANQE